MISNAKFIIPKLEGYVKARNVITLQRPSELSDVTANQALKILNQFKTNNKPTYDTLFEVNLMQWPTSLDIESILCFLIEIQAC